ncbi:glycosyltransferase [Lamprobacter modestohalophilus]|uniref:glycosyltransferase family 2 protein n=1 Tax=Lamprobacter modestohalophilus TaxID=1064514 RepID=UPI002ADEDBC7|nr:glycosyltransferase [Lamprobacter modestohalophilus]MEA1052541.1 glycosyltransferase [Lamprobacter modestohalophilus]
MTLLERANRALLRGDAVRAIRFFVCCLHRAPIFAPSLVANLQLGRHRFQSGPLSGEYPRVLLCSLSEGEAGATGSERARGLARLYASHARVALAQTGLTGVASPRARGRLGMDEGVLSVRALERFLGQVLAQPSHLVHLAQPALPTILVGFLAKLVWGSRVVVDLDAGDLAIALASMPGGDDVGFDHDTAAAGDGLLAWQDGPFHEVRPSTAGCLSLARACLEAFDGLTVANSDLQQVFGGLCLTEDTLARMRGRKALPDLLRPCVPPSTSWQTRDQLDWLKPLQPLEQLPVISSLLAAHATLPAVDAEPGLSIVVLTLDGADLLRRLLQSLARHRPRRALEIIVVDHGSRDETAAVIANGPCAAFTRHLNRGRNYSFAASCNVGAREARFPLLLFLNNDIELCGNVIDKMVARLADPAVSVVGIEQREQCEDARELQWHHRGVAFRWDQNFAFWRPFNVTTEDAVLGPDAEPESMRPPLLAVTGSMLLVARTDFEAVDGFHEAYVYGYEDVDFCLAVTARLNTEVACVASRAVIHGNGVTRAKTTPELKRRQRVNNLLTLEQRFRPLLNRHQRRLLGQGWTLRGERPHVAFAVRADADDCSTVRALATALGRLFGWRASVFDSDAWYALEDVDALIVMDDDYDPRRIRSGFASVVLVAWAREGLERWLQLAWREEFDGYLVSSRQAAARVESALGQAAGVLESGCAHGTPTEDAREQSPERLAECLRQHLAGQLNGACRIAIKVPIPGQASASGAAVQQLAEALGKGLRGLGHRVRLDALPDWHRGDAEGDDVSLVLRGSTPYRPRLSQINLLWLLEDGSTVPAPEANGFDHVFVASSPLHEQLRERLRVSTSVLLPYPATLGASALALTPPAVELDATNLFRPQVESLMRVCQSRLVRPRPGRPDGVTGLL